VKGAAMATTDVDAPRETDVPELIPARIGSGLGDGRDFGLVVGRGEGLTTGRGWPGARSPPARHAGEDVELAGWQR
jgi:hypothetical protein